MSAARTNSHVRDEAPTGVAAAYAARQPIVLANSAGAANAPGRVARPHVLEAGAQHWDAVDPSPLRAAKDPLDAILGGRKRRAVRFK
jgi:hypothetical protein